MLQLLFMAPLFLAPMHPAQGPFVELSFAEALAQADDTDRLIFIDFYTEWCGPCKRMDRETWTDEKVIHWLQKDAVAIKVDADVNTELRDRYRVAGYPTLLFLDSRGYVKGRILGFRGPGEFLAESRTILQTISLAQELQRQVKHSPLDPRLKLQLAKLLLKQSDYDQALDLCLRAYDFAGTPAFDALDPSELGDALAHIKDISKFLGRAREELDLRWQIERLTVLGESPSARSLEKLLAIDNAFGFVEATLKVYDELLAAWPWEQAAPTPRPATGEPAGSAGGQPSLNASAQVFDGRPRLFEHVLEELVRRKRYGEVLEGFGDPLSWMRTQAADVQTETLAAFQQANPTQAASEEAVQEQLDAMRQEFLQPMKRRAGLLYQALLGTPGQDGVASELAQSLIELDPRAGTWKVLMRNARAAGRKELRDELYAAGLQALPAGERSRLSTGR